MFASDYFQNEKAFRALLPGKIALTVVQLSEDMGISPRAALGRFYTSQTYNALEDESTKRWWESPRELCRDFAAEKRI